MLVIVFYIVLGCFIDSRSMALLSAKSKTSKFSAIRETRTDFGMAE